METVSIQMQVDLLAHLSVVNKHWPFVLFDVLRTVLQAENVSTK